MCTQNYVATPKRSSPTTVSNIVQSFICHNFLSAPYMSGVRDTLVARQDPTLTELDSGDGLCTTSLQR